LLKPLCDEIVSSLFQGPGAGEILSGKSPSPCMPRDEIGPFSIAFLLMLLFGSTPVQGLI